MKKNMLKLLSIVALLVIVSLGSGAWWVRSQLEPVTFSSDEQPDQTFIIKKGEGVNSIGLRLHEARLIKNARVFSFMVRYYKLTPKIQAGSFSISPAQSPKAIAETFTRGTEDMWITLLEGWRVEEIAEYLANQEGLSNFDKDNFVFLAKSLEGTLYPDTYLIPKEMSEEDIISLLTNTFESKTSELLDSNDLNDRSMQEILVMASLVQREANRDEDMRRVAGILWNRMEIDMALQVDATLQYARAAQAYNQSGDETDFDWWATPLAADKSISSAFNTYQNTGLPPAPICNPGIDAISATVNPLESEDLFYIHAPDGKMYYSATLQGHNENVNRYLR